MINFRFPCAVLVLLQATGFACSTEVNGHNSPSSSDAATNAVDGAPSVDADTSAETQVELTPAHNYVAVGEQLTLTAKLVDEDGEDVSVNSSIVWSSADNNIASVVDGVVSGVDAGNVEITARIEGKMASVRIEVFGDLAACCNIGAAQTVDNFCNIPPSTASCPMTAAGGACDVDGDGDFDELTDAGWAAMFNFYAAQCDDVAEMCTLDNRPQVPNVATDCSANYSPSMRQWRCVELTTDFPGTLVSQVCQDLGGGPRWYTYNLTPLDCCACEGQNVPAANGAPAVCMCTGNGCF